MPVQRVLPRSARRDRGNQEGTRSMSAAQLSVLASLLTFRRLQFGAFACSAMLNSDTRAFGTCYFIFWGLYPWAGSLAKTWATPYPVAGTSLTSKLKGKLEGILNILTCELVVSPGSFYSGKQSGTISRPDRRITPTVGHALATTLPLDGQTPMGSTGP